MPDCMAVALVTGASSGMGEEFCRSLDKMGLDEIWLVARRLELMQSIASELSTPSRLFQVDLTDKTAMDAFLAQIAEESPKISYLVNCAGFGRFGMTWEIPREVTRSMIDLNVGAVVDLVTACVPLMPPGSHIIELCSESAYLGMYDLNVYASTKAFVRHFCNGLRTEVKPLGITVTEVSPGWVDTEFIPICKSQMDVPPAVFKHTVTKEAVVSKAMKDALNGKPRSICGAWNRVSASIASLFPRTAVKVWRKYFE